VPGETTLRRINAQSFKNFKLNNGQSFYLFYKGSLVDNNKNI
jgi:hypothetical protein